jgi:sialic acid synthase SpsE
MKKKKILKKTFFIVDIVVNSDGLLFPAKKLIRLYAKAGADVAKFQNFKTETIVRDIDYVEPGKNVLPNRVEKKVFQIINL